MQSNVSVLIAAKPSRIRDSLYVQLKTVSGINIIGFADDSASSLRMISEHRPALVLLDTNLPGDEMITVLKRIKTNGSQSRCLVLSDTFRQQREARSAGADAALVKGFQTAELFQAIEELLQDGQSKSRAG